MKIFPQSIIKLDHKIDYRSFSSVHPMKFDFKLKKEKLMNEYQSNKKDIFKVKTPSIYPTEVRFLSHNY